LPQATCGAASKATAERGFSTAVSARLAHPLLDPVALLIDKAMIGCGIATRGNLTKEE